MLYIACDHAGYALKQKLVKYLSSKHIEFVDLGTDSTQSVDFPVYCKKLVAEVKQSTNNRGILICGSGIGMSICANRNPAIRAALCHNVASATLARQHNDANVLVLAGRTTSAFCAKRMVKAFLNSNCLGGKYIRRMNMIDEK